MRLRKLLPDAARSSGRPRRRRILCCLESRLSSPSFSLSPAGCPPPRMLPAGSPLPVPHRLLSPSSPGAALDRRQPGGHAERRSVGQRAVARPPRCSCWRACRWREPRGPADELADGVPDSALAATVVFPGALPRLLAGSPLFALRFVPAGTVGDRGVELAFRHQFGVHRGASARPQVIPGITARAGHPLGQPAARGVSRLGAARTAGARRSPGRRPDRPRSRFCPRDRGRAGAASRESCHCAFALEAESPAQKPCGDKGLGDRRRGRGGDWRAADRSPPVTRPDARSTVALLLPCRRWPPSTALKSSVMAGRRPTTLPLPSLRPCSRPCEAGQPNFQFSAQRGRLRLQRRRTRTTTADGGRALGGPWPCPRVEWPPELPTLGWPPPARARRYSLVGGGAVGAAVPAGSTSKSISAPGFPCPVRTRPPRPRRRWTCPCSSKPRACAVTCRAAAARIRVESAGRGTGRPRIWIPPRSTF